MLETEADAAMITSSTVKLMWPWNLLFYTVVPSYEQTYLPPYCLCFSSEI